MGRFWLITGKAFHKRDNRWVSIQIAGVSWMFKFVVRCWSGVALTKSDKAINVKILSRRSEGLDSKNYNFNLKEKLYLRFQRNTSMAKAVVGLICICNILQDIFGSSNTELIQYWECYCLLNNCRLYTRYMRTTIIQEVILRTYTYNSSRDDETTTGDLKLR